MAYSNKFIIDQSLKAIKDNNLFWQTDIFAYVPFSESIFYERDMEKVESIKKELYYNRVKTKQSLKSRWYKTNNPTLNIALYKLIGTEDEVHKLAGTKQEIDHTSKGEKIVVIPPVIIKNKEKKD